MTAGMWSITGSGAAKNRAFAGVMARAARELGKSDGAGDGRHETQRDEGGRNEPVRLCRAS